MSRWLNICRAPTHASGVIFSPCPRKRMSARSLQCVQAGVPFSRRAPQRRLCVAASFTSFSNKQGQATIVVASMDRSIIGDFSSRSHFQPIGSNANSQRGADQKTLGYAPVAYRNGDITAPCRAKPMLITGQMKNGVGSDSRHHRGYDSAKHRKMIVSAGLSTRNIADQVVIINEL